jgi:homoserine O-acetyltransferase
LKVQNKTSKFYIPQFKLDSGELLENVEIAYTTYGTLSEKGDNAVLIFHALTGSHMLAGNYSQEENSEIPWNDELEIGWWDEFVGVNKLIDTEKYFVVCANYLGGCYGTTGPNSIDKKTGLEYGENFPNITFKDIETSQKQLLDDLGVKSLKAVIGPSIGGLMALEFSLLYPDFVENLISISSGYKLSTIQLLHNLEQAYVLNLAKNSPDRRDEYLSLARMIAHKTYISLELLTLRAKGESKYGEDIINGFLSTSQESYMMHQGEKFIERFTHESYNSIIKGWQNFSIDVEKIERLKDIKVLVVSVDSDVCFYPEEQSEFIKLLEANQINVTHKTISSTKGHDCFLLEPDLFEKELGKFI